MHGMQQRNQLHVPPITNISSVASMKRSQTAAPTASPVAKTSVVRKIACNTGAHDYLPNSPASSPAAAGGGVLAHLYTSGIGNKRKRNEVPFP